MNSALYLSKWGRRLGKTLFKPIQKRKPESDTNRWNIVRGDSVQVTQGPQTGQSGKVLAVLRDTNRLIIENVNMVLKSPGALFDCISNFSVIFRSSAAANCEVQG